MDDAARNRVIDLLQSGAKRPARAILVSAIRKDPADEFAWLALAQAVDDAAQKRDSLDHVLALNPANALAAQMLADLADETVDHHPPEQVAQAEPTNPINQALAEAPAVEARPEYTPRPPQVEVPSPAPVSRAPSALPAAVPRPQAGWLLPAVVVVLLLGVAGTAIAGVVVLRPFRQPATVALATSLLPRPTPIRFPTLPPEWTATPGVPTSTHLPSVTASLTPAPASPTPGGSPSTPAQSSAISHLDNPIAFTLVKDSGRRTFITDGSTPGIEVAGADQTILWLPGGQGLIYMAPRAQAGYRLFRALADGSQPKLLVELPHFANPPSVSPDGRRVAYTVAVGKPPKSNLQLVVMNIDGTNPATIFTVPEFQAIGSQDALFPGDWSPDGKRIVFQHIHCATGSELNSVQLCDNELYLINPDGTKLVQLTSGLLGARTPRWSPDGKQILFGVGAPDEWTRIQSHLMLIDVDGSNLHELALTGDANLNLQEPDWSPDGKLVVFTIPAINGYSMYIVPVDCFATADACSWSDVVRLPVQAQYVGNLVWKGSPPIARGGTAAPPTIPAVTPLIPLMDNWTMDPGRHLQAGSVAPQADKLNQKAAG